MIIEEIDGTIEQISWHNVQLTYMKGNAYTNNKFHELIFYSLISNFLCRQLFKIALEFISRGR